LTQWLFGWIPLLKFKCAVQAGTFEIFCGTLVIVPSWKYCTRFGLNCPLRLAAQIHQLLQSMWVWNLFYSANIK
jgi:hypothetical protein